MRLTGLWWWIDRWRKSTAYMDMTLAEQGAYRNLLDEAHLRGGAIPANERVLAKACGDARLWKTVRPAVLPHFMLTPQGYRNETLDAVLAQTIRRAANQANYRHRRGPPGDNEPDNATDNGRDNGTSLTGDNTAANEAHNKADNDTANKPDSPDPKAGRRLGGPAEGAGSTYKQRGRDAPDGRAGRRAASAPVDRAVLKKYGLD